MSNRLTCLKCGCDTSRPPDDFPPEYLGYCPSCSAQLVNDGRLPAPDPEVLLRYMTRMLTATLEHLMGDIDVKSPSEIVCTPVGQIQYSQN